MLKKRKCVEIQYNTDKFKFCVSQMYLKALSTNIKRTYDQINLVEK